MLDPDPWLRELESGALEPHGDLIAVLAERFEAAAAQRLLAWWLTAPERRPELADGIALRRDPHAAALLRQALDQPLPAADGQGAPVERQALLLPLLGHQRDPADFARLRRLALAPGPARLRRAALEGLAVGLSAWPRAPLRQALRGLAGDLDPRLAEGAVDLLARLPAARGTLRQLAREPLDPAVASRLERRLARLPAAPLLLVVHGRAGGSIPGELRALAKELELRRDAPVRLQALTAERPPRLPASPGGLTLVPLFLLPGGHVRRDLAAIAAAWLACAPLRRLPFLGAWPAWQRALAAEVADLAARSPDREPAVLLHHPLEGPLGARYLAHLSAVTGAACRPAPYSAPHPEVPQLPMHQAVLPLALAANRLTDSLAERLGPPLLQRPRFRDLLLQALEDLP
ncbi:MAG: hypothetical protein ER33_11185 [Cyanobium sp. CACIAM 14]|nr:MAG: hypothetical protein ER33_11185 [Cyanobium sp. CACIAM 14]